MTKPLDKKQFKAAIGQEGRQPVSKKDLTDALKQVLLADQPGTPAQRKPDTGQG